MDELKTLLPGELYTLVNGEQVMISPIPFGKINVFSEAVAALVKRLRDTGLKLEEIEDWKTVFDVAFGEVIAIEMLVLDKPREWFNTFDIADGLGITEIIVRQNFSERTKKNLKNLIEKLTSLFQMQSKPSFLKDIAGAKLKDTRQNKSDSSPEASSSSGV